MPSGRSARRVLAITAGIAAVFDLTGTVVYRTMRPVLPPSPPSGDSPDPFASAMSTIMAAHHQAAANAGRAHQESGEKAVP